MKETFYFPHDYNARTDDKVKRLIRKHGMSGYGIFWSIIEDLYNNDNSLIYDCEGIAYELRTDEKTIDSILNEFDLFVKDGDSFGSISVQKRLEARDAKSKKARESARKRWDSKQTQSDVDANALQTDSDSNAIKERKGKEKKKEEEKNLSDFDKALKEFKKMRVKIRAPLTEYAEKTMMKKLEKLAGDNEQKKIEILEQSIMNCWKGVFQLNTDNNKPQDNTHKPFGGLKIL